MVRPRRVRRRTVMFGGRAYPLHTAFINVTKAIAVLTAVGVLVFVFIIQPLWPSLHTQRQWTTWMGAGLRKRLGLGEFARKDDAVAGDWGPRLGYGAVALAAMVMAVACWDVNRMATNARLRR